MTMAPAGCEGQGPGRQQRRRDRRPGVADRAQRGHGRRLASLQHRPRQGRPDRRAFQAHLSQDRGEDLGVKRLASETSGRSAAARCGRWTSHQSKLESRSITGRANPGPWNPLSAARRQQVERRPSSPAIPKTVRRRGRISSRPHDLYDYDGVNENLLLDLADRRRDEYGRWSGPTATVSCT